MNDDPSRANRGNPVVDESKWGGRIEPYRWRKLRELARSPVLDCGCGAGAYVRRMLAEGIDAQGADVREYKQWRGSDNGHFHLVAGDGCLPFEDQSFDTTLCFEVLEHVPDPQAVLREVVRVTRRCVLVSVPNCEGTVAMRKSQLVPSHWTDRTHVNFFTRETLRAELEKAGLAVRGVYLYRDLTFEWFIFEHYPLLKVLRPVFLRSRCLLTGLRIRKPLFASLFGEGRLKSGSEEGGDK